MELRTLEYFVAVAEEGTISAAAERLHLTQPTLSKQLKEMEEELGTILFERGARKVTLTRDGLRLKQKAQEILSLAEQTKREFQTGEDGDVVGDVNIGAGETMYFRLVAQAIGETRRKNPGIRFHITDGNTSQLIPLLMNDRIDFALCYGNINSELFNAYPLSVKDIWGVYMKRDDPLAEKERITCDDLMDKPLILSQTIRETSPFIQWLKVPYSNLNIVGTYNLLSNAVFLRCYNPALWFCCEWRVPKSEGNSGSILQGNYIKREWRKKEPVFYARYRRKEWKWQLPVIEASLPYMLLRISVIVAFPFFITV